MRAPTTRSVLLPVLLVICAAWVTDAAADSLYVGHGRRSVDDSWSVRLNLGGGVTSASDPWEDELSDTEWPVGGYATAGLEFNVGHRNSLELYGSYRDLDDEEDFLEIDEFGDRGDAGRYRYGLESWSGGMTLRHRYPHRSGASYWGVGGGLIEAEVRYEEIVGGRVTFPRRSATDTAPEAHALVGWDGKLSPALTLGLEVGFRYTWLEYDAMPVSGDYTGFFGGLRLGIVLGGGGR